MLETEGKNTLKLGTIYAIVLVLYVLSLRKFIVYDVCITLLMI